MTSLGQILLLILNVGITLVLVQVVMSWLITFQVLNMRQPLIAQLWNGLNRLLEPAYQPIRRFLPASGGLDFAPLVFLLGLYALRLIVFNNFFGY